MKLYSILAAVIALLTAGCAAHPPVSQSPSVSHTQRADTVSKPSAEPSADQLERRAVAKHSVVPAIELRQRLFLPESGVVPSGGDAGGQTLYSFKANGLPTAEALMMFARTYHLNMIMDPYTIVGTVTVEFHDVAFDQAMEAILHTAGYHWYRKGGLIFVEAVETRQFVIDFLATKGDNRIWAGLEGKLQSLLSDSGKLVISELAGTIQVTDAHANVEDVAKFLNQLRQTISRQVEIEMKIVEVTLNDSNALGIDWSRIKMGGLAVQFNFGSNVNGL
ncbi:MAG: hypothetical protein Q9M13_08410, partial [Mariprofundales bacterium]|nr:hypothetical protein [Mariprofundales bacterium]